MKKQSSKRLHHLDPNEDMYSAFRIRTLECNEHRFRFFIHELHYTRPSMPGLYPLFWMKEMLFEYPYTLDSLIQNRLLLAANIEPHGAVATDEAYQTFCAQHPQIYDYLKWRGYAYGEWQRCTKHQFNQLKNERPQAKWHNKIPVYGLQHFNYKEEDYYCFQTYEHQERLEEIATYSIYALQLIEQGIDKELDKSYQIVEIEVAPELLFLIPNWLPHTEWTTSQVVYED